MLALASGDVAGGLADGGYSHITQTATVVAYHLMVNGMVDRTKLTDELLTLDGRGHGVKVYRKPSAEFRSWLNSAHAGEPMASSSRSAEPASRMGAVGVWFRRDPQALVEAAVSIGRLTHLDATSVAMGVAVAGGVAGASTAMSGVDLILAVAETVESGLERMEPDKFRFSSFEAAQRLPEKIRSLAGTVSTPPELVVRSMSEDNGPVGIDGALLGVALAASRAANPVRLVELAAMSGGSEIGGIAASIIGARIGLGRWPWRVPNETWFAEIGRRLVVHNGEVRDLPVPYAIEERFNLSPAVTAMLDPA